MAESTIEVRRPRRWDVPFGAEMNQEEVERLLRLELFREIDRDRFPAHLSLADILLNDTRVVRYERGDIIVREGDYGNSAFILLRGSVRVAVEAMPRGVLGRTTPQKKSLFRSVLQGLFPSRYPEVRTYGQSGWDPAVGQRAGAEQTHVFLQDIPGVLDATQTVKLRAGSIFGELAAMSRTPRAATVFAEESCALLEIRWQGLRDIMKRDPDLKSRINALYRESSLEAHLSETPLLKGLPPTVIRQIADGTLFESHGEFEWHAEFIKSQGQAASARIQQEPVICEEGTYADGLILLRNGFARLSRKYGDGHRTLAYLGKGQLFGLEEMAHNFLFDRQLPWQNSLRAVGYVDILRIPTHVITEFVFPSLPPGQLERLAREAERNQPSSLPTQGKLEAGLMEFILDERVLNGTQTMLIDMDRCTRCDDCVRACAATHDGNPRFTREGPIHDHFMVAHACMHCADPVCMIGCPTGAIGREIRTGTVLINDATCIGCATCANSCPYQNIKMVETRHPTGEVMRDHETQQPIVKATKCDLCTSHWGGPACQRACPHDALVRIDLNDETRLVDWLNRG